MFQYSRSRPPTHRPSVPKSQNPNVAEKISLQIMACARLVAKQKKLAILILKAWFPYGRKHVVTAS